MRVLFGLEQELAAAGIGGRGEVLEANALVLELLETVRARYPSLPAEGGRGLFLGNGGKIYHDCSHPEVCTPEVSHPLDLVRYVRANERIVSEAMAQLVSRGEVSSPYLGRGNVCYVAKVTFGTHENYSIWGCGRGAMGFTHRRLVALEPVLTSHLATRVLYTGTGGFDCRRSDLSFLISPRSSYLATRVRRASMWSRGLFSTQKAKYGRTIRLHVNSGEGIGCDWALWLATASTALVLATLAVAGPPPDQAILRDGEKSAQQICRDATLRSRLPTRCRWRASALDIQQRLFAWVAAHRDSLAESSNSMQSWVDTALARWQETIDLLTSEPERLVGKIDWITKLSLYRDAFPDFAHQFSVGAWGVPAEEYAALQAFDMKFAELGEASLCESLRSAGYLENSLIDRQSIESATTTPPKSPPRARFRGEMIHQLATTDREDTSLRPEPMTMERFVFGHSRQRYEVNWDKIVDRRENKYVNLEDAFAATPEWESRHQKSSDSAGEIRRNAYQRASRHYARGDMRRAARLLDNASQWEHPISRDERLLRIVVGVRRGTSGVVEELRCLASEVLGESTPLEDRLLVANAHLFAAHSGWLVGDPVAMQPWVEQGNLWLGRRQQVDSPQREQFALQQATYDFVRGAYEDAVDAFTSVLRTSYSDRIRGERWRAEDVPILHWEKSLRAIRTGGLPNRWLVAATIKSPSLISGRTSGYGRSREQF